MFRLQPFERHGGKVDKVLAYKAVTAASRVTCWLISTADNLFTDYDIVED